MLTFCSVPHTLRSHISIPKEISIHNLVREIDNNYNDYNNYNEVE